MDQILKKRFIESYDNMNIPSFELERKWRVYEEEMQRKNYYYGIIPGEVLLDSISLYMDDYVDDYFE
jgi:hypothetical protein